MSTPLSNRATTTPTLIAEVLRGAIESGELEPGQPLRQEELATRFKVSRIPVRDALKQLETEGLVVIYPNRGAFVADLNPKEILEVYEIRILLEVDALRRALPKLSPLILDRAEAILEQMEREANPVQWSELDDTFHTALYLPAERPKLLELIGQQRTVVNRFYFLNQPLAGSIKQCHLEHRQLLEACRQGNFDNARAALESHLESAAQTVAQNAQQREQNRIQQLRNTLRKKI
ncbi:hypothetical protein WA1_33655 [Scytonema hofmannii PCC 7110]|uniref:HTH gntR-type domain-containing protein n=1 Tax=Scytonema hofmannii PCC 7110 TaxID=128403 RepID=A0A139X2L8_9CYAN|nr:GntR family transcriptional regulator [Scytonema hofmannii]KYC38949.1 hypothetical protein WA1_33655 [Scytonema hofmannii PCC 7110]